MFAEFWEAIQQRWNPIESGCSSDENRRVWFFRGEWPRRFKPMREQDVSERLAELLKQIYVPEAIARTVVGSLHADLSCSEQKRQEQVAALCQRLAALRTRMDQLYEDKLEAKITEAFWARKQTEYSAQERSIETALSSLNRPITPECVLTVERTLELAQKAHALYLTRNHAERGQLLRTVLLNCATDGVVSRPLTESPSTLDSALSFVLVLERRRVSGIEQSSVAPSATD